MNDHKAVIHVTMHDGSIYPVKTLLSKHNLKLEKSNKAGKGFLTVGLTFSPAHTSGYNVCAGASVGCIKGCLRTAGHNTFAAVRRAQIAKTRAFFQNREAFKSKLFAEIAHAERFASRRGLTLAVRLNVLSDVTWEVEFPDLFTTFPDVQFYDYTKVAGRTVPTNYHLTFSRSESNEPTAIAEYARGLNVAVVFATADLPTTWNGIPVFSGDETDMRFLDARGVVGLYAKGKATQDTTGFVVPTSRKLIGLTVAA